MFPSSSLKVYILLVSLFSTSQLAFASPGSSSSNSKGHNNNNDSSVQSNNGGKAQVITKCTVSGTAALTFDDGPYQYLTDLVDTMKKAGAKGTVFLNGNNWACIYDPANVERVKYAYDNGFQIASHTWAHKNLTQLGKDELTQEFTKSQDAIQKITGATPRYTRPPYGNYNDLVQQVANEQGQTLVNWDFDSGDSLSVSASDQKARYDKTIGEHPDTILSLEHEVYDTSVYDVLPYAVQQLQKAGYKLVTLAECLGEEAYASVGDAKEKDDTWTCSS